MSRRKKIPATVKIGKDISVLNFIKSRIITPREIKDALFEQAPVEINNLSDLLFDARYLACKAIEGYDFF